MKKLFDQIDWTVTVLIVIWAMGLLVGVTTKPAEVRAHDPKPVQPANVQPANVRASDPNPPNGFRRVNMDRCIYYWRDVQTLRGAGGVEHVIQPFFVHAAGCTNHAPCAQTVLQLEK